jgi:hypothetical protein
MLLHFNSGKGSRQFLFADQAFLDSANPLAHPITNGAGEQLTILEVIGSLYRAVDREDKIPSTPAIQKLTPTRPRLNREPHTIGQAACRNNE